MAALPIGSVQEIFTILSTETRISSGWSIVMVAVPVLPSESVAVTIYRPIDKLEIEAVVESIDHA